MLQTIHTLTERSRLKEWRLDDLLWRDIILKRRNVLYKDYLLENKTSQLKALMTCAAIFGGFSMIMFCETSVIPESIYNHMMNISILNFSRANISNISNMSNWTFMNVSSKINLTRSNLLETDYAIAETLIAVCYTSIALVAATMVYVMVSCFHVMASVLAYSDRFEVVGRTGKDRKRYEDASAKGAFTSVAPADLFMRFWGTRCKNKVQVLFLLFDLSLFAFLINLGLLAWIKFYFFPIAAIFCSFGCTGVGIFLWFKARGWFSFLINSI